MRKTLVQKFIWYESNFLPDLALFRVVKRQRMSVEGEICYGTLTVRVLLLYRSQCFSLPGTALFPISG